MSRTASSSAPSATQLESRARSRPPPSVWILPATNKARIRYHTCLCTFLYSVPITSCAECASGVLPAHPSLDSLSEGVLFAMQLEAARLSDQPGCARGCCLWCSASLTCHSYPADQRRLSSTAARTCRPAAGHSCSRGGHCAKISLASQHGCMQVAKPAAHAKVAAPARQCRSMLAPQLAVLWGVRWFAINACHSYPADQRRLSSTAARTCRPAAGHSCSRGGHCAKISLASQHGCMQVAKPAAHAKVAAPARQCRSMLAPQLAVLWGVRWFAINACHSYLAD